MKDENPYFKDQITLRDIILGIRSYARLLWQQKWIILLGGILGAVLFGINAYRTPVTYQGRLTFMLNEDEGSGGGLSSILGQVGLGGGNTSEYNLEKIVALSESRLIMQQVLMDSVTVQGKSDRLAHHLIEVYDLRDEWTADGRPTWAEVEFFSDSVTTMDITERKVLQHLHGRLVGTGDRVGILKTVIDPATGILRMIGESLDQEFTQAAIESAYDHLSRFYVEKVTAGPRGTYQKLRAKTDSIKQELQAVEYRLASSEDSSLGLMQRRDRIRIDQLQRESQLLNVMYAEALKNLSTAEFTLETMTPFFAVIDRPFLPLKKVTANLYRNGLMGAGLFAFFAVVSILVWNAFSNILNAEESKDE